MTTAATFAHLGCGTATPSSRESLAPASVSLGRVGQQHDIFSLGSSLGHCLSTLGMWLPLPNLVLVWLGAKTSRLHRRLRCGTSLSLLWVGAETGASAPGLVSRLLRLHLSCGVKAMSLLH